MTLEQLAEEYRVLLRRIARKEAQASCVGDSWHGIGAGNVEFQCDDWKFMLFNDCDSLDYTDWVIAPDGTIADFDQLYDIERDPICFGDDLDRNALYCVLSALPPHPDFSPQSSL